MGCTGVEERERERERERGGEEEEEEDRGEKEIVSQWRKQRRIRNCGVLCVCEGFQ